MLNSVQKLCSYIPYFETTSSEPMVKWKGGEQEGDSVTLPYPEYDQTLYNFIGDASASKLIATDYMEVIEKKGLNSIDKMAEAIDKADLNLLRAILTWIVRSERFSEGSWAAAVEAGAFLKILKRLQQLYPM